ncbi:DNA-binding protein H-NS [Paraburkholderia sp. BL8N3]|nr:DNA-binding protein H-NS [Paraburkholderia sp. BL8N3]
MTDMTYKSPQIVELMARRSALENQLAEAREKETRLALIEIVQKMREYGITVNELLGRKPSANAPQSAKIATAYRDPVTGATWSGRGRAPGWIAGKNREEFRVPVEEGHRAARSVQRSLF